VSLPGEAPPLMEAKEDIRLLHQELGGKAGTCLPHTHHAQQPPTQLELSLTTALLCFVLW